MSLNKKTILITGASRGIGRAMAYRFAKEGANLIIVGKTVSSHSKFEGTIHETVEEVEKLGGSGLAVPCDVRDENQIDRVIGESVKKYNGLDIVINNAGAISLNKSESLTTKHYDLMMDINVRGAFLCTQKSIPYLKRGINPQVLFLAPPLNMNSKWFKGHCAYTVSKYAMSLLSYGLAQELSSYGIRVNSLWPKTTIATDAVKLLGGEQALKLSRSPSFTAEAAYCLLSDENSSLTGQSLIDEDVLIKSGVNNFDEFQVVPNQNLLPDLFVD